MSGMAEGVDAEGLWNGELRVDRRQTGVARKLQDNMPSWNSMHVKKTTSHFYLTGSRYFHIP